MSAPMMSDEVKLKRLLRYLAGRPRGVYRFRFQHAPDEVTCFVDSDWAGCSKTRKSTSGGAIVRGSHCLAAWSRTQSCVALSSGEAELGALVRGATEGLGLQAMMKDLDMERSLALKSDATAAIGMVQRLGLGRVRHLAVGSVAATRTPMRML